MDLVKEYGYPMDRSGTIWREMANICQSMLSPRV